MAINIAAIPSFEGWGPLLFANRLCQGAAVIKFAAFELVFFGFHVGGTKVRRAHLWLSEGVPAKTKEDWLEDRYDFVLNQDADQLI